MHSLYVKLVQLILTDASEDVGEADLIDRSKQMADRFNQRDGRGVWEKFVRLADDGYTSNTNTNKNTKNKYKQNKWPTDSIRETDASREVWEKFVRFKWMMREEVWMDPGKFQYFTNKLKGLYSEIRNKDVLQEVCGRHL